MRTVLHDGNYAGFIEARHDPETGLWYAISERPPPTGATTMDSSSTALRINVRRAHDVPALELSYTNDNCKVCGNKCADDQPCSRRSDGIGCGCPTGEIYCGSLGCVDASQDDATVTVTAATALLGACVTNEDAKLAPASDTPHEVPTHDAAAGRRALRA